MRLKQITSYMSIAIPVAPPLRCNVTGCLVCTEHCTQFALSFSVSRRQQVVAQQRRTTYRCPGTQQLSVDAAGDDGSRRQMAVSAAEDTRRSIEL